MSLQGTGSAAQYWSGAGPFGSYADRPFTLCVWVYWPSNPGHEEIFLQLRDLSDGAHLKQSGGVWSNTDTNDAGAFAGYIAGTPAPGTSWFFLASVFANGGNDAVYLNAGTAVTGGAQAGPCTYGQLQLPGTTSDSGTSSGFLATTTLIAEATIWSGALSAADIGKLYNGGAGGKGVNPLSLQPSGGAWLVRYYLRNGFNDFADHSGRGGVTLAAQGGATAIWSGNNPPVNAPALARANPPLVTAFW